jgi:hypothetical protein
MTFDDLRKVRTWAGSRMASEAEPPWARHLYTKLGETLDALLAGAAAAPDQSQGASWPRRGNKLRLVASNIHHPRPPAIDDVA